MDLLLDTGSLDTFLQSVAEAGLAASQSQGCGVTLLRTGRPVTVVSAGLSASRLDEKQYGQDDGPCLQALREGEEVSVPDMRNEKRWGDYPAFGVRIGTLSSLSLPIA